MHDTLERVRDSAKSGPGIGSIDHVFPLHCITNDCSESLSPSENPTARQLFGAPQEMSVNCRKNEPGGLGLRTTDHFEPFQCSTSVVVEFASWLDPTAV